MAKPTAQQCHALTSYYVKAYTDRYKVTPNVNRNTARWGFESILMDLPSDAVRELIDFYFASASSRMHPIEWFFNNYHRLLDDMAERQRDREQRERLRAESAERAKAWQERGMKTIENERE